MATPVKLRESYVMRATGLTAEYETDPVGLATPRPRFSWRLDEVASPTEVQLAYEIEVTSGDRVMWNSGTVPSPAQVLIPYAGTHLHSRQRCAWKVRLWSGEPGTKTAIPGPWSAPATFELGLLQSEDWANTAWISPPSDPSQDTKRRLSRKRPSANRPSPLLRKEFEVDPTDDLANARLYCSALGIYDIEINGTPVSNDRLRPGFTAYDHRIQHQTYDVSALLVEGRNTIGITLADGWWRGRVGVFRKPNNWGTNVAAIARLEAGGRTLVQSDATWKTATGGVRRACLFNGEAFDARLEPDGWTSTGFDDDGWSQVVLTDGPTSRLLPQVGPSVHVVEQVPAQRVFHTPSGATVVDFGQNLAGVVKFTVCGPAGSSVQLTHGETLTVNGEFTSDTFGASRQQVRYTLGATDRSETYAARFTYHGFRYVRIDEWPTGSTPVAEDFTALVLSSEARTAGGFECSHNAVNRLVENIDRSQVANFVEIPTDCPTREKAGWTGDIAVFGRTGALNRHIAPILTRWLGDVRADQLSDGRIPCVVPVSASYNAFFMRPTHGGAAWADACVDVPWTLYLHYGDHRVLEENYTTMCRWVDALDRRSRRNPWWAAADPRARIGSGRHRAHIIDSGFQWAEWLAPGETLTRNWLRGLLKPDPLIATAYYARTLDRVARIASILNHSEDAQQLRERRELVVTAVRQHLFATDGLPHRRDQIGLVACLAFGLIEEAHRAAAGEALACVVRANDAKLATGFTMTPLLCPTLVDTGYTELAYDVLLGTDIPSWLYPISRGATTVWETWDAIAPDGSVSDVSQNHYAFGAIGEFLHRYVAGLDTDPERPGYEHVRIEPRPDPAGRLTSARAHLETARGPVSTSWTLIGGRLAVDATIPVGATATITVGSKSAQVGAGTHHVSEPFGG
ncbi:MAG: family 78 glycoside hydrolase catalytic domain [Acidimicrobiales bacterium]